AKTGSRIKQHKPWECPMASASANFLVVMNRRCRSLVMNDETDIRLINPHTKCIGRTYHFVVICHEFLLDMLPGLFFASSMIIFSLYTLLLQKHRYHFCIMFRRVINDASSGQIWKKLCQVGAFIQL